MMQTIMAVSERCNISPFDILNKDFDDFALMVNYFLESNGDEKQKNAVEQKPKKGELKRVKVNDKTATGGWW